MQFEITMYHHPQNIRSYLLPADLKGWFALSGAQIVTVVMTYYGTKAVARNTYDMDVTRNLNNFWTIRPFGALNEM